MWTENINMLSWMFLGLSVVCLLAGCLFLVCDVTLLRTKYTFLELDLQVSLHDDEEHDHVVENLQRVNSLRRTHRIFYIVFFTFSLLAYAADVYVTEGELPFDLLAFCICVTVSVAFTLLMVPVTRTMSFKCSIKMEVIFAGCLFFLWTSTLLSFFYLFPWLGCTVSVIICAILLWAYRVLSKKSLNNN